MQNNMLYDIWREPVYHPDGSVNRKCLYFSGVSLENKIRILADPEYCTTIEPKEIQIKAKIVKVKTKKIKEPKIQPNALRDSQIIESIRLGIDLKEIAYDLGVSYQIVTRISRKNLLNQ